jgi:hypothetical protein
LKDIKIAIVGSESKYWSNEQVPKAILKIHEILIEACESWLNKKVTLVSGGCPKGGVDIWAEIIAKEMKLNMEIYKPEVEQWEDHYEPSVNEYYDIKRRATTVRKKGYKSRNMEIAEACDVLYCIDPANRNWSGARWTMQEAEKLGKYTHLVLIE